MHCSSLLLLELLDESEESPSLSLEEPDDEDETAVGSSDADGTILGAFFKCSRKSTVIPPSPMDVKKLIAKRVFRELTCVAKELQILYYPIIDL